MIFRIKTYCEYFAGQRHYHPVGAWNNIDAFGKPLAIKWLFYGNRCQYFTIDPENDYADNNPYITGVAWA